MTVSQIKTYLRGEDVPAMGLLDGRKAEDYKTYQAPMGSNMSRQPKLTFSYSNDKPLD